MHLEKPLNTPPTDHQPHPHALRSSSHSPATKSPPTTPSPPPNGGLLAWLHVLAAFMLWFNTWGIINAYGVFQTHYSTSMPFRASASSISWIGSIQSFLVLVVGIVAGPIYDRGYLRSLLIVGSASVVAGHVLLSFCMEYWQVLLAQGVLVGVGGGCLFLLGVSVLPMWFSTRLGLAIGLGSAGSSVGGVVYPVVLRRLIDEIGFAWAVRVVGCIALGTLMVPIAVMRVRAKPPRARAMIDWSGFTDVPFIVFVVATMVGFMGLNVFLFYLSYDAAERHITDTSMSFYIVAIFNAASTFGRVVPNALSDMTGPFNLIAPCAVITGILVLCRIVVQSEAAIIIVAILVGVFSGVFIAMPPVCLVALIEDKSRIGTRMGMSFGIIGLGMLVGGPGGGGILGTHDPLNWDGLWAFGGVTAIAAGVVYAGMRVMRGGLRLNVKV